LLEPPAAAPLEDLGPIPRDEVAPGRLVGRVVAEAAQQRDTGRGRVVLCHEDRLGEDPNVLPPPSNWGCQVHVSLTSRKPKRNPKRSLGFPPGGVIPIGGGRSEVVDAPSPSTE